MKIVVLHTADALELPVDPLLDQLRDALGVLKHDVERVVVDCEVEQIDAALRNARPDIVFNVAESFGGKSALESNVAALLNLLGLHYTGSSPAGLLLAGDKSLTK